MECDAAEWLLENLSLIPRGLPVLDVASGKGRHTLYLARAGWPVLAIDRDRDALNALAALADALQLPVTTEVLDLEKATPSLGERRFGAVIVFNYLHRPLMPALIAAVAPGGVLIYETFTVGQATRGHPKNPDFLLEEGELAKLVAPLDVLRSREGDFGGKLISSIVAKRPECPDRVLRSITAGRGIPAGGVAPRSNMPNILTRCALPSGRRAPAFTPRITRPGH